MKAGSIVLLSPYVWHCSGGNESGKFRRAYMAQYSNGVVKKGSEGGKDVVGLGVPVGCGVYCTV